jgi:hypothetical protein
MSGNASTDDPLTYALWWFTTGSITRGQCTMWLYIPKPDDASDIAGHPSVYQVLHGRDDLTVRQTFTIDQTAHLGSWVSAGPFTFDNRQIAIKLVNRGTSTSGGHAAAQVQAACGPQ